jgi:AraC-like DNA-binding protein
MLSLIKNVDFVIKNRYKDPHFNVQGLCRQVSKTQSYLYQVLVYHYDQGPAALIENCRLNHSLELLKDADLNLTQIAYRSGYRNYKTFCNAFFKRFKLKPAVCRHEVRDKRLYSRLQSIVRNGAGAPLSSNQKY